MQMTRKRRSQMAREISKLLKLLLKVFFEKTQMARMFARMPNMAKMMLP